MPEETREDSNFKVVDRRPFTVEGARREDAPVKDERPVEPAKKESQPAAKPGDEQIDEGFAMLVELLANGALTHLGLMDTGETLPVNLPGARAMIDLIGVLEEKTKGNLSAAEQRFTGQILFELHTRFVEAQKQTAPKRK
ncbi:MAG: DUF1844 domain-containing protein [Terriglobia bacterium]